MTTWCRAVTAAALATALSACLPSEVDCYVSPCADAAAASGSTSGAGGSGGGAGAGGATSTACGRFAAARQLVSATPEPSAIAVDADAVYWIDPKGGYRVAKSAATPLAHPPLFAPTYRQPNTPGPDCPGAFVSPGVLALTADAMIWTLWDHCSQLQPWGPMLWVAPKMPDGAATWGEGSQLRDWGLGVAIDGKQAIVAAYYQHDLEPQIVTANPAIPDVPMPPAVSTPYYATSIAVTSQFLYFADHDVVGLRRASRANLPGAADTIDASGAVAKLVADPSDGSIYYLSGAALKRYPGSGAPTTIATEPGETPADIAIDDACVYWALASGHVRGAPKQGGGPVVELAAAPATTIAADGGGVYFGESGGSIWMVPKAP